MILLEDYIASSVIDQLPGIITAITGLVASITALIIALRSNRKMENEVKPQMKQQGRDIAALQSNPEMNPVLYTQPISVARLQERIRRENGG
jgi:hypothetical protein